MEKNRAYRPIHADIIAQNCEPCLTGLVDESSERLRMAILPPTDEAYQAEAVKHFREFKECITIECEYFNSEELNNFKFFFIDENVKSIKKIQPLIK